MKCIRFTPLSTLRSLSTNQNAAEIFSADDNQPSPPHKKVFPPIRLYTVVTPNTADLGSNEKAAVFGNRRLKEGS